MVTYYNLLLLIKEEVRGEREMLHSLFTHSFKYSNIFIKWNSLKDNKIEYLTSYLIMFIF